MNFGLQLLLKYKYFVLFPLAAFEGPLVSLAVGFLVHAGVLSFWPSYLILISGDIIPDSIFYYIGYFGDKTRLFQKYFSNSKLLRDYFPAVLGLWRNHPRKTMFFGKLAYGMALPFLVSFGMTKLSYKKFISYTVPISIFQYGLIMWIGYGMGGFYEAAGRYLKLAYFAMTAITILLVILYVLVSKYSKRKIAAMGMEEKLLEERKNNL